MLTWLGILVNVTAMALFPARPVIPGIYEPRADIISDVYLRFYNGNTTDDFVDIQLQNSEQLLQQTEFNLNNLTTIYVHGYKETTRADSIQAVVSSYLEARPDVNVVVLDWSAMAYGNYITNAVPNSHVVAEAAANEVKKLTGLGLPLSNIHLIGHSLGGQIAGFIGRSLQRYNITLKRISALDPAFPMFYFDPFFNVPHIEASDAEFVDAIHTDVGFYGAHGDAATVDFWPNRGSAIQPGCPGFSMPLSDDSFCSHSRSWRYWSESVRNPTIFPAVSATSYQDFISENRVPGVTLNYTFMGIDADLSITGEYYLITNAVSPFGKGLSGIDTQYL